MNNKQAESASFPAPSQRAVSAAGFAALSPQAIWVGVLTLLLVFGFALPAAQFFSSPMNYLPLHTALEFVAMAVSAMVFALAWNLRQQPDNSHRMLLGTGFLAVGLIDFAHTLSYPGMPDLITPSGSEKAINFWLAGRYVAAGVLLAVALLPLVRWSVAACRSAVILAIALAAGVWWVGLSHVEWLPRTFVAGQGLTGFKIGAEYLLAVLYGTAAILLFLKSRRSHNGDLKWLAAAAWVQGLAEMFFTLYANVTDLFNLLGHVYKAIAYLMVYRAMFVSGIQAPYRELDFEHARLQSLLATVPDLIWLKDAEGVFLSCNKAVERLYGAKEADIIGKTDYDFVERELADFFRKNDRAAMAAGSPTLNEEWLTFAADGYRGLFETTKAPMYGPDGQIIGVLGIAHDITEHNRAELALQNSADVYRNFVAELPLGIVVTQDGLIRYVNRAAEQMIGYPGDELLGIPFLPLVAEEDRPRLMDLHRRRMSGEESEKSYTVRMVRKDGEVRLWQGYVNTISWDGKPSGLGSFIDITEREQAEVDLRIASVAFESQEAMMVTDANSVILRVNWAFTETTGYSAEEVVGQTPRLLKSGRHDAEFYRVMWESIKRTGGWQGEIWDRRKDGEIYPKLLTISAVKGADGVVTHYIGTHFDITERKQAEDKIRELAFFDQLTGLPNRTLLLDRLRQAMAASSRSGNYGALLFIDLDNFKTLNDTLGHDMGDLLLLQVARRLTLCVRDGDTVARLGGDEFIVVLAGLSTGEGNAATGIEAAAEKILATLNQPYQLDGAVHHSTASIGVTLFRGDHVTVDDLMKQADLAMYKAKAAGRNAICFFNPTLESSVKERAALEHDLRQAMADRQYLLHYQAQVAGGQLTGVEVLMRWQHPQRGLVSPAEFIPLAEETGLILPLGRWVLETACTQLAAWAARPEMRDLTVAVNVSAHQFRQTDFVDEVSAILKSTGANPQRLKLELTESLLVSNVEDVIEKMFALKAKGVGFSLDDFGTGYSSLSYLKRLPLDQLKIDQSFVRDVLTDPNDASIARTIIALAQNLGLGVIAEGVETEAQRTFLANSGCHAYQGYLFSRPLPLEEFEAFARRV
ncbi:MAG: EAL domain-containing protein [Sulfuritalea sp.]|nr:EAL domain-containing protein [Sulfuritalea sp.]